MAMETGRCYGGGDVERQKMRAREEKEGMWECYFIYFFFFIFGLPSSYFLVADFGFIGLHSHSYALEKLFLIL